MKGPHKVALLGAALALYSATASAQLTNQGMLDQVVMEFATRATAWQTVVMQAATFLFWTLGTISLAITFGFMALRKADIGEFFAEFIRFILFFGFFLWLLRNGPAFANSIIQSLARIGEQASGIASVTPSGIVDVGFLIWKQAIDNLSAWSPIDSFIGVILSAGILLLLAVIAVNMLLLLVSAWLLAYAGVFFLGFGGARWTSDMAVNYYKTVLGVAVQIMTMVLLVGIGNDLLSSFYARMNTGTLNFEELGVMLVFCLALLLLVNRVPPLIAGITTGAGTGGAGGIGSFGAGTAAGAALSAASMAAGAASMAGAAVMNGATSAAGGASAIKAAFEKAGASAGNDMGDMLPSRGGNGDADAGSFAQAAGFGGGGSDAGTSTPLAQAAGFANRGGEAGAPRHDGSRQDAFGRHASSTQAPGADSPPSRVGTGRVLGAAMATLGQGVSDVAKAKAAGIQHLAAERIADTAGGKVAAAIRAGASKGQTADVESPAILEDDAPTGSASASSNAKEEVAAFRDRSHGPAET